MIDPEVLTTVSVPLALEDAVPVALSTAGFLVVARGIRDRVGDRAGLAAVVAAVLIGLGGLAKVSWKVLAAGFERDVVWLDELLFPLLSVGFVGMVVLLHAARRDPSLRDTPVERAWIAMGLVALPVLVSFGLFGIEAVGPGLLPVAVTASLVTSWWLFSIARGGGDHLAAGLIVANVTATLSLAGLARVEEQTLGLQWVEQSINTVSQGLFLWAAVRVSAAGFPWARTSDTAAVEAAAASRSAPSPLEGSLGNHR